MLTRQFQINRLIIIFLFLCPLPVLYAHPITQISYDITIKKEKSIVEIKTKQNLAFLFCKDFISDFEKYDKEYKRLTALTNDEFYKEVLERKIVISAIIEAKLSNLKLEETSLVINIDTRQPQLYLNSNSSEDLLHSVELNCEIIFTGKLDASASTIIWKNEDFIISDILKISIHNKDEFAIVWVTPMEEKEIGLVIQDSSFSGIVKEFIIQGFQHILPSGVDHILFVLCLFFLFTNWKFTLLQISTFTIAHSITLILVTLKVFYVNANIVEPLIALSICVVGIENLASTKFQKYRLIVIFLFGLLHGMGFADALNKIALPENKLLISLISFNIGVEIGQLAVLVIAFLTIGVWFSNKEWYRKRVTIPCSLLISIYAFYLFIDRI